LYEWIFFSGFHHWTKVIEGHVRNSKDVSDVGILSEDESFVLYEV
jgi:hypothetical protein